jgi:hypothetical protein
VGELKLLDEHGIRPAELGKVVQHAATADTAADDHRSGSIREHDPSIPGRLEKV